MADFNMDDIRAAVAANILTEAQATRLKVFAENRLGYRDHMRQDDEPFELFKGFAEIFITVGLGMLFAGIMAISLLMGANMGVPLVGGIFAFLFAFYFTKKRRMNLPSILLATVFAANITGFFGILMFDPINPSEYDVLYVGLIGMVAMAGWFHLFKLPFSMFLFGAFGLIVAFAIAALMRPNGLDFLALREGIFDLNNDTSFSSATLIFGVLVFCLGMFFDMRDPHRVSRFAASGFWLHVLAAPAIVNTVALTLYNSGGTVGYALTALALLLISIAALIIDRRSFLTAGIIYMAWLLSTAFEGSDEFTSTILTLLILGVFITVLGTWWAQIRAVLMNMLPNFPLKNRLPPYLGKA